MARRERTFINLQVFPWFAFATEITEITQLRIHKIASWDKNRGPFDD